MKIKVKQNHAACKQYLKSAYIQLKTVGVGEGFVLEICGNLWRERKGVK